MILEIAGGAIIGGILFKLLSLGGPEDDVTALEKANREANRRDSSGRYNGILAIRCLNIDPGEIIYDVELSRGFSLTGEDMKLLVDEMKKAYDYFQKRPAFFVSEGG